MSSANPDPEESNITGLEPGGGVPPGETPPGEGSMSSDQGHQEGGSEKNRQVPWLIGVGVVFVVAIVLAVAGRAMELF